MNGPARGSLRSFAEGVQVDFPELCEDYRILKFAGRGIAGPREGDGASVRERQRPRTPLRRKRARRFLGVAGGQIALVIPIERDDDVIRDVHGMAPTVLRPVATLRQTPTMCNLYSQTKGQEAIRSLARVLRDVTGNLPPMPGIFPDYPAPIVRNAPDGARELTLARWGMPTPPTFLKGKRTDPGVTNVRNAASPHWRRWLGVESRCVVPFTSFSENEALPDGSHPPVWFALGEDRPLAFFAGIWTRWTTVRKVKEGETTNDIFAFLTTEPNAIVKPIHAKAMPVILTTPGEIETWLTAPAPEALKLQRPLPDDALRIVARGERRDGPAN